MLAPVSKEKYIYSSHWPHIPHELQLQLALLQHARWLSIQYTMHMTRYIGTAKLKYYATGNTIYPVSMHLAHLSSCMTALLI